MQLKPNRSQCQSVFLCDRSHLAHQQTCRWSHRLSAKWLVLSHQRIAHWRASRRTHLSASIRVRPFLSNWCCHALRRIPWARQLSVVRVWLQSLWLAARCTPLGRSAHSMSTLWWLYQFATSWLAHIFRRSSKFYWKVPSWIQTPPPVSSWAVPWRLTSHLRH